MYVKSSYGMKYIKILIFIVVMLVLIIMTNLAMYHLVWKPKIEDLIISYENELLLLDQTLADIGQFKEVYTVRLDTDPGKLVEQEDLELKRVPESFLSDSYVHKENVMNVVGKYYKVGLKEGSPMLLDIVMEEDMDELKTTRELDIVTSALPIGLEVGNYIDLRIVYPMGEDFIVLSHKRVQAIHNQVVTIMLNEEEIHLYQSALVDYLLQKNKGAALYMTEYVEPGIQSPSQVYYRVPDYTLAVMKGDPNIDNPDKLDEEENMEEREELIDAAIDKVTEEVAEIILEGREEVLTKLDEGKESYEEKMIENEALEQIDKTNHSEGEASSENEGQLYIEEGVVD
ncbi:CpaB family protein [Vallitalea okinawensis]|uniref:hypothetical protein n=1 Tax=Vallitalea okinawensis TaxID=2078660 RepID=UPI000CFB4B47|nr:hypothetical protein [Vallitalea okinawensis]